MTKQTDRPDNALLNSIVGYSGSLLLHTKGKAVGRLPFQSIRLRNKKEVPANWFLDLRAWQLHTPEMGAIDLTPNEFCFLKMLISTAGNAVPRDAIARALYGRCDYHSSRSLDSLVRRLRIKIKQQTDQSPPIKTAHGIGYIFSAPVESSQPLPSFFDTNP